MPFCTWLNPNLYNLCIDTFFLILHQLVYQQDFCITWKRLDATISFAPFTGFLPTSFLAQKKTVFFFFFPRGFLGQKNNVFCPKNGPCRLRPEEMALTSLSKLPLEKRQKAMPAVKQGILKRSLGAERRGFSWAWWVGGCFWW